MATFIWSKPWITHWTCIWMLLLTFCLNGLTLAQVKTEQALVLVDSLGTRETHSQILHHLNQLGLQVTLRTADDPSLQLVRYGQHLYEHVLLLSPHVQEFGGAINIRALLNFVDAGGNLLITGDDRTAESVRELAAELGVEFERENYLIIDHANFDRHLDNGSHSALSVPSEMLIKSESIVGKLPNLSNILYRGTALFTSKKNPLLFNVLPAPATAYSSIPYQTLSELPNAIGSNSMLVCAIQTRNNARVVVSGSLEMFADQLRDRSKANQVFTDSLVSWVTHHSGVLRVSTLRHGLIDGSKNQNLDFKQPQPKATYTIGDKVLVQAAVEQKISTGQWVAYKGNDVQIELRRVDPYVRVTMRNEVDGRLSASLTLPDVCGVYTLVLKHNRIGHTYLSTSVQFSVRPLEHTQYERFIPCALPYYASAFSMMLGVYLFSFVFLYNRSNTKQKTN